MVVVKLPVFVWQGEVVEAFYSRILSLETHWCADWATRLDSHFSLPKKERKKKKRKEKTFSLMQQVDMGRVVSPLFRSGAEQ